MAFGIGMPRFAGRKPRMENLPRGPRISVKPRQPRLGGGMGVEPHETRMRTDSHIVKPYRPGRTFGTPEEY